MVRVLGLTDGEEITGHPVYYSIVRLEGDTVVADITFVPSQREEQLTCEATNEAVTQPFRQSIQVRASQANNLKKRQHMLYSTFLSAIPSFGIGHH